MCLPGVATIKIRAPNQVGGTRLLTVRVDLDNVGSALHESAAKELCVPPNK